MEELDRELRLAQDACQRLKSQVFVAVSSKEFLAKNSTLTMVVLGQDIVKVSQSVSFYVFCFISIFFVPFPFHKTKLLTVFLAFAVQINLHN